MQISWLLILRILLLEKKTFQFLQFRPKSASINVKLPGLRTFPLLPSPRCHVYRMMLCYRCSFVTNKKNRWIKCSLFRSLRLINNKINRLHKSTYDNSVFVLQKKLTISYYGIIEIKLNKVWDFFKIVFVKRHQWCNFKTSVR